MKSVMIKGVTFDRERNSYLVTFNRLDGDADISLPISGDDARSIASLSQQNKPESPGTHRLIRELIDRLGGRILSVRIHRKENRKTYSNLELQDSGGKRMNLSCSLGDGIMLALAGRTPMWLVDHPRIPGDKINPVSKKKKFLEKELAGAIKRENYELAATIRDKIRKEFG